MQILLTERCWLQPNKGASTLLGGDATHTERAGVRLQDQYGGAVVVEGSGEAGRKGCVSTRLILNYVGGALETLVLAGVCEGNAVHLAS